MTTSHINIPFKEKMRNNIPQEMGLSKGVSSSNPETKNVEVSAYSRGKAFQIATIDNAMVEIITGK